MYLLDQKGSSRATKLKAEVEIDSYHRHISFSCTTYFDSEYGCVDLKRENVE
jgi:hypothetical protein